MNRRVYPTTNIIFGMILIICGVLVIIIGPNVIPYDIFRALQRVLIPGLFYSPYNLMGGAIIIMGGAIFIIGLVFKLKGYEEGDEVLW